MSRRWFAGVDVGGTFTDVALASSDGDLVTAKVATTPNDPRDAVAAGLAEVLDRSGVAAADVTRVVHGTTLATNVILERRGGPVAFVTTEGFGDMLRLGREVRGEDERFDLSFAVPVPPVAHRRTFEVRERSGADGAVVVPLDEDALRDVVDGIVAAAPASVAVCLLHSYANPAHERRVADACRAALGPSVPVVASCDVWPEVREYERAMTTVMCAYVGPVMTVYLDGLVARLGELGITCPVEVMESSGGVMSAHLAAERPVFTVESGGAAGVTAAGFVGALLGVREVISFDMGGTTAKAGIVRDGRPAVAHGFHVGGGEASRGGDRAPAGFPIKVPVVDLAEVGAGGGSIAWLDAGGALRVGPRSAGSDPGPACYGAGGTDPTVTDANLVLGYLRSGELSGGVSLSVELARRALRTVAEPLGLSVEDAAHTVHAIVNANMAAAIRMVTVERGIDPRDFTMVGFGGAGPIHLARLAETFGIGTIAVPWAAGVSSAVGLVTADLAVDRVRTRVTRGEDLDPDAVNRLLDELADEGAAQLPPAARDATEVVRWFDVRYRGQAHQLTVPAPAGDLTADDLASTLKSFEAAYEHTYGIAGEGPVDVVSYRVRVVRLVEKYAPPEPGGPRPRPRPEPITARRIHFAETGGYGATPVFDRDQLEPGDDVPGPAVIDGVDTTIVVPPGHVAAVDGWRNVLLRREAAIDQGSGAVA